MRLCINCRWHEEGRCLSPKNVNSQEPRINPVTGEINPLKRKLALCSSHRTGMLTTWIGCRMGGYCGAEGRWFTPKENP